MDAPGQGKEMALVGTSSSENRHVRETRERGQGEHSLMLLLFAQAVSDPDVAAPGQRNAWWALFVEPTL